MEITQELLLKLLRYEPETGKLFWRDRPVDMFVDGVYSAERICSRWNARYAGEEAGCVTAMGYIVVGLFGKIYKSHRLIFMMMTGEFPPDQIDHINHRKSDNRWANICNVTPAENGRNQSKSIRNTSGTTGVVWNKADKKWRAQINPNGKNIHLGCYVNKSDAIAARADAEKKFGFHKNHGAAPK